MKEIILTLIAALDERMREIATEVVLEELGGGRDQGIRSVALVEEETRRAIQEHVLISHKTYLTRKEAAKYLAVSERSIAEWTARPADLNPFPESQAGGEPRTKRVAIDEWAEREKQRQRLKLAG